MDQSNNNWNPNGSNLKVPNNVNKNNGERGLGAVLEGQEDPIIKEVRRAEPDPKPNVLETQIPKLIKSTPSWKTNISTNQKD